VEHQRIRPSAWSYALAAIPLVIGCVALAVILFLGISGTVDSAQNLSGGMTRIAVPGRAALTLDEVGGYTIFHEYQTVFNGRVYSNTAMSPMDCTLTSTTTGASVPIQLAAFSSTYEFGRQAGQSVMQFEITEPGTYDFSCRYTSGAAGPEIVLAIGHGFMGNILGVVFGALGSVFGSIAVVFGSVILALIIVIIITVRRYRSKQRLENPMT
jgi:hypothetical protein